ncbi:MAG: TonB-dependent receptor, partial [Bacteroidota bacterium]
PSMKVYLAPLDFTLEGVVVEAEQNAGNLKTLTSQKLDGEALGKVATGNLGEVASQIAGVSMLRTGQNVAKPIIHGLHSNRVLVINNGLRHEFQNWGIDHAPEIDPSMINQLEVIKGAATVRYGPDALGGVILTKSPKVDLNAAFGGEVQLTGKSNGQSGEGTLELHKGFKWFSLLAGGSYLKQGDLQAPDYFLTNTGKEEYSYYGAIRIHPIPELDIEGFYSFFDQNLGILQASIFGNLEDLERAVGSPVPLFEREFSYDIDQPRQNPSHELVKAKATYTGEKHVLSAQYGYQVNERKEFGARRGDAPNIDLILTSESLDLDWFHPNLGPLSGKIGFQAMHQDNENQPGTNTVPFIPNFESKRYGGYWIETLTLGNNQLELGARFDHFDAEIVGREPDNTIYQNRIIYNNASGTIGYLHQLNEHTTLRSNLGTAWRPPNVAELYRFGQHNFFLEYGLWRYTIDERFDFVTTSQGILDESDREVPAEIGYKWINTLSIQQEKFQLELTGYVNYIENFIYSKPGGLTRTTRGFFVFYLIDQADAIFYGVDAQANVTHSAQLESQIKASYVRARQINPDDEFANIPPLRLDYGLTYDPTVQLVERLQVGIDVSYTFEQQDHPRIISPGTFLRPGTETVRFGSDALDFDILAPPESFFLANFHSTIQEKQFILRFQVRNLLNTSYRTYTDRLRYFADDLGRNFILTLGYKF